MTPETRKRDYWPDPSKSPPVSHVKLIPMEMNHVDKVLKIERDSFPTPWSVDAFEYDLTENQLAHYWVTLIRKEIVGYSGIWLVGNIAHLTTLCIEKDSRRLGLGKWLLLKTMQMGAELGAQRYTLEVRESNEAAIKLYEGVGYRTVGRRPNYYQEIGEDALVMWTGDPPYED